MAKFITLTLANAEDGRLSGLPMRFPASIAYRKAVMGPEVGNGAKSVVFFNGGAFNVRETPEQIDAMLGVTERNQSAADIAAEPIQAMIREKHKHASGVVSAQVMSVLAVEAAVLEEAVKVIYAAFGAARGE